MSYALNTRKGTTLIDDTELDKIKIPESKLGWLAGIIDGEGHIGITYTTSGGRHRDTKLVSASIDIVNTNVNLINKCVSIIRAITKSNPNVKYRKPLKSHYSDSWCINLRNHDDIKVLLELMSDYLVAKNEHALLVLKLIRMRYVERISIEEQLKLKEEVCSLNSKVVRLENPYIVGGV